jgi:hypothetical protein
MQTLGAALSWASNGYSQGYLDQLVVADAVKLHIPAPSRRTNAFRSSSINIVTLPLAQFLVHFSNIARMYDHTTLGFRCMLSFADTMDDTGHPGIEVFYLDYARHWAPGLARHIMFVEIPIPVRPCRCQSARVQDARAKADTVVWIEVGATKISFHPFPEQIVRDREILEL